MNLTDVVQDFKAEVTARFVYYISTAVVIVFLSRELQPKGYGTLFLAISVLSVCRLFSSIGLSKSAAKHVSYYLDVDDSQIRHIVRSSIKFNIISIAIVASAIVLGAEFVAAVLGEPAIEQLLIVGAFYIVFATIYNYTRVLLQGLQEILSSAIVYASEGIGRIVGVLILVSVGFGMIGGLVGYILGFALAAVIGLVLVYSRLPPSTAPMEEGLEREILSYSVPLAVTRGAWVLDREIDIILVGYFLNPTIVGFYTIGKQIVTFCSGAAGSIGFSLGPKFNEASIANDEAHASHVYERILVYILLLYIPAVTGLAILADPIVMTVFGENYRSAVPIIQVFCAAIVLIAVTETTEDILDYLGRASVRATFKGITSVGNAVLTVLLIHFWGAIGAAVATVSMRGCYAVLCLYVVRSEIGLRVGYLLRQVGHIIVIASIMAGVVLYLVRFADGIVTIGAIVLCGTAIWGFLAIVGGYLDVDSLRNVVVSSEDQK